jgi:hypothetical protein
VALGVSVGFLGDPDGGLPVSSNVGCGGLVVRGDDNGGGGGQEGDQPARGIWWRGAAAVADWVGDRDVSSVVGGVPDVDDDFLSPRVDFQSLSEEEPAWGAAVVGCRVEPRDRDTGFLRESEVVHVGGGPSAAAELVRHLGDEEIA